MTLTAKDKTDANTWVASFTNLPQYEAGKEITYSIKEVDVPAGYEASVTGQVVTNLIIQKQLSFQELRFGKITTTKTVNVQIK